MPALNPSQLHALVQSQIPDNNNNLIDPAEVRAVLDAIIDSVYNLVTSPAPDAPTLAAVLAEGNETDANDIIATTGRYIIFRDPAGNKVRVRPVQSAIGSVAYRDITLPLRSGTVAFLDDLGGASWLEPVVNEVNQPTGSEADGTRYLVGTGATMAFAGHAGDVAELVDGTWTFKPTDNGDMVRCLADTPGTLRTKTGGLWVMPPDITDALSLQAVLGVGNTTAGHDIEVSDLDALTFKHGAFKMRLVGQDIAADHTVTMPDDDGALATVEVVNALLATLNLHAVLVNGNETAGRSIQVSEFDGVNFLQGANYVRVKGPAVVTAQRTLLLQDKDGAVATLDDVNAVAAMVDGALRAPEAYTPAGGLYPATYGGAAIERGDSFRCASGTMGGVTVNAEDLLIALVDAPGQVDANWQVLESNRVVATQVEAENSASTDLAKLMPPQRWWQAWTKGLTLSAFAAAVRGMVLTGYTVGANAAVAATDSIMGAIAKLQGQLNATNSAVSGKLAKASNLSDLTNTTTARTNLGLKALAIQDNAQALVSLDMYSAAYSPQIVGQVVVMHPGGSYDLASPSNAWAGRLAIIVEVSGGAVRVQTDGILRGSVFAAMPDGGLYYLDKDTPGLLTATRPLAHPVVVGQKLIADRFVLSPSMPISSGSASLAADDMTTLATGKVSALATTDLIGGATYEVNVYASTSADAGSGRCRLWLDLGGGTGGKMRGNVTIQDAASKVVGAYFITSDLTSPIGDATPVIEGAAMEVCLRALVTVDEHYNGPCAVVFGPLNDTYKAHLLTGSVITWNRIG